MKMARLLRFRIWHMLAVVSLLAIVLSVYTDASMNTALIEIEEFDVETLSESQHEVFKIKYKYVRPESRHKTAVHVFFNDPVIIKKRFEIGNQIRFRYRDEPLLWLKPVDPDLVVIEKLGVNHADVGETITETVY